MKKKHQYGLLNLSCFNLLILFTAISIPTLFFGQDLQELNINGVILSSESQQPIPGVNIIIKGTSKGTNSDFDGKYYINAKVNDVLVFSFLGYETREVKVISSLINIELKESLEGLDEIVLIGYGASRQKDLTGSVTKISSKDFQQGFVTNAEQLIANKVPGVQITPVGGRPGSGSSFLIRGGASLGGNRNRPLFVIDGAPIGLTDGPGVLSALNPDDIESFVVLKDAAAAAIYGSRGSNGVILITTKSGNSGKFKVTLSTSSSLSQVMYKQSVLNGGQFREAAQKAADVSGNPISNFNLGSANTDWQDEIYKDALTTDMSLSISGGLKNIPYRLSVGRLSQDGTLRTGNFTRTTATLNLNPKFFDNHLKININIKGIQQDEKIAPESAIFNAISFDPTQPVRDPNSPFGGYWQYQNFASNPSVLGGHFNPVASLFQTDSRERSLRSISNIQLDYKVHFLPDLSIKINTGFDINRRKWSYFTPANAFPANISNGSDTTFDPSSEVQNTFLETTLNYSKDIESIDSNIELLAGYSYNDFKTTNYFYQSFDVDGNVQPGSDPNFDFDIPQNTLISYFGRAIYTLKNKYILTGTIRTDGSSRFSENYRWGVFPSVSGAWKINEENFLKDSKVVSNLKLRAGYGITGQQEDIGNYSFRPIYNLGGTNIQYPIGNEFIQGINPSATDRNRRWEQSETYNLGIDWGLFNNRFSGSFEVYFRDTKDLLNDVIPPSGTDFLGPNQTITKNIGSLENKGFELKFDIDAIRSDNFNWYLGVSYGYNKNKITRLSDSEDDSAGLFSSSVLVNSVGFQRNTFYLYRQVYDTNGNPIENQVADINGDGLINENDRYRDRERGSVPRHNIGFNTNFNYKKLSVNMAFHSNIGHYIFARSSDNLASIYSGLFRGNLHTTYLDTNFTQTGNVNQQFSDFYLQNASFVKMDNISFNYDFGNILNPQSDTSRFVVSASVQNVFVITDYEFGDPEPSYNFGSDTQGDYTSPRTFTLGLNINF